ncbi:MAG: class I SAM-dependent methyltransferase [Vicinamibacteria bacterium]
MESPPNAVLMEFIEEEMRQRSIRRVLDIGCGAARNAAPLAALGLDVVGTDLSWPMLQAARARALPARGRLAVALAPMDVLPVQDQSVDAVVAHGIWNLARTDDEFRRAVRDAARVSRPGGSLFVFTFSRHTLPKDALPVPGETFVFTQFSGQPQCFLTERELVSELRAGGFVREGEGPLTEYNRPRPDALQTARGPVIYEGTFRRTAA